MLTNLRGIRINKKNLVTAVKSKLVRNYKLLQIITKSTEECRNDNNLKQVIIDRFSTSLKLDY